uniref:Uncharacterized protein n=1 Tax=Cacopsylla melanoneura TaxID=428564 RepID=A0A8D8WJ75_9HEMI
MANFSWSYPLLFLRLSFGYLGSVEAMDPYEADYMANDGNSNDISVHQNGLLLNKDNNPAEGPPIYDSRQQEPADDGSNTQCPDNSSQGNDNSLQNNSTDTNRSEETNYQHLRSHGIYAQSEHQDDKSEQTDWQHLRSQGIYEKSGNSEQTITVQRRRSHGRFGRLKRNVENLEHGHDGTTQSKNRSSKARYTRRTFYSRKPRPFKETCNHGLEITNDHHDLRALRAAFERVKGETRKRITYRTKSTTCRVMRNVTRTKKTRRKTEEPRTTVGRWNMGDIESSTVDHIVKRRNLEANDGQIHTEGIDGKRNDQIHMEGIDGKRKKRNLDISADGDSIIDKLNRLIAENAGLLKKRTIKAKNGIEDDFRRKKRAIRPNYAMNDIASVESDERFDVKYEPELLARAETLLNHRDKRFVSESKLQYVSRGAREKAYRSYEDYKKKTKHECPEDKVCRLFKQEMNREDSFDGMGMWNE